MTSEAGSRPLRARLAPTGAAREREASTESASDGQRPGGDAKVPRPPIIATSGTGPTARAGAATGGPTGGANNTGRAHRPDKPDRPNDAPGTAPAADATAADATAADAPSADAKPADAPAPDVTAAASRQSDTLAALLDEAQAAVSEGANTLRDVRERYRAAYLEQVGRWEALRAQGAAGNDTLAQGANEAMAGREVGFERSVLERIDLSAKSLENAWLFLAREDTSLVSDPSGPPSAADAQMRIVEAQEAERSRLAREIHDGPAQALSNAIFQVEVAQRLLDRDEALARAELKQLRDVLTRELGGVRAYLSQLRPPLLADLGLSGAIGEAADQIGKVLGIHVTVELDDGVDQLPETVEIVALRVIQEALQNARKHAQPTSIRVRMVRDDGTWAIEIRDDGKGFESDDPPIDGRRNFGLQFMRERAELIGARFEVRSVPNLGTAVRMTIPPGAMGMPIPGEERS